MATIKKTKIREPGTSTLKEKICYAIGDMGCNFIWSFTAGFLTLYYTDSVGLAASFIGTMMLMARLLDGGSDILMGIIIEKTATRWGKARPWILFGSIPFAISLILLFNVPSSMEMNGKNVYATITYIFMAVIAYTMVNLAYNALMPRFSLTPNDRNIVSAVRGFGAGIISMILNIVTPMLLAAFGGEGSQRAWTMLSAIYAVAGFLLLLVVFFGVKERVQIKTDSEGKYQKTPIKEALRVMLQTKYFYIAVSLCVMFYITNNSIAGFVYYSRDVLGDSNLFGVITTVMMIPMLAGMPFMPTLYKKFGKRNTMMAGSIITVLASVAQLLAPANVTLFLLGTFVKGLGMAMFSAAIMTLASDVAEYTDWKAAIRAEGLITSINSFGMKVGTGIGSGMVGWFLAWGNYNAAETVQSDAAITAMIVMVIVVPLMIGVLQTMLLVLWDFEKCRPKMMEDMEKRAEVRKDKTYE